MSAEADCVNNSFIEMTREEFRAEMRKIDVDNRVKEIDPHMVCFGNALDSVTRSISTLGIQYRNADNDLEIAIRKLRNAVSEVTAAYINAKKDNLCINDYTRFIQPDFASVDNATGLTNGNATVVSVKTDVDVDGIHMYFTVDNDADFKNLCVEMMQ